MKKILLMFCFSLIFWQAYSQCNVSASYSHTINQKMVSFTGNSTPGGTGQYTWFFGDGNTATGKNVQHVYDSTGIYSVCVKFEPLDSNNQGNHCFTTFCDSVTIAGCNFEASFTDSILGNQVHFAGNVLPYEPGFYTWFFGDGTSASGQFVQHEYSAPGNYDVCMKYQSYNSNSNGDTCYKFFCDTITIASQGCNFEASFTDSVLGNQVHFAGNVLPYEPGYYTWFFGDGTSAYGQYVQHEYSAPGNYGVCMKYQSYNSNSNGDTCYTYFCDTITIAGEACNFEASFTDSILGKQVHFAGNVLPYEPGFYTWYFGDGTSAYGQYVQHEYSTPGNYGVCMKYQSYNSNSNGDTCYQYYCDTITIADTGCNTQASFNNQVAGKLASFSGSNSSNEPGSYTWSFGDGSFGYGDITQHYYSEPGVYAICMTYSKYQLLWDDSTSNYDTCSVTVCDSIIIEDCNVQASFTKQISGNTVTFSGLSTPNLPGQYSWYFGDGSYANGKNIQHTYSAPGDYVVCMSYQAYDSLSNGDSCYAYMCDTITIEGCNIQASFTNRVTGNNVTFAGSSTPNEPGIYSWNFGDGAFKVGENTQHTYSTPGSYSVCMTYQSFNPLSNGDTCFATFCDTITIAGCTTQLSFKDSLVGKTVYLTGLTTPLKAGIYEWTLGDGKKRTGRKVTYQYANPGTYNICVKFKSTDGLCNIETCKTITIRKCYVTVRFTKSVSKDTVRFTAVSAPDLPGTYYWNFGDGTIGSGKTTSHIYGASGNYPVTLSFYSDDSKCICETVYTDTVTIKVCPKINFTQSSNGKTVTFAAYSNSSETGTYYWNFGDGTYGIGQTASHTYSNLSNYTATVEFYAQHGFCKCLCKTSISQPVIFESCNAVSIYSYNYMNYTYFSAYPSGTGIYQWNFGDGSTATTYNGYVSHYYSNSGSYIVELTAIVTSDDHMDTCVTSTLDSIYTNRDSSWAKEASINLYPMPAAEKLNYSIENTNETTISSVEIVDLLGVVVKKESIISSDENSIDVSNLPTGLYIVKIVAGETVYSKSFLKE